MAMSRAFPSSRALTIALASALTITIAGSAGCYPGMGPLQTWRMARDQSLAPDIDNDEYQRAVKTTKTAVKDQTVDSKGWMSRWLDSSRESLAQIPRNFAIKGLSPNGWQPQLKETANPKADKELADAEQVFRQGDLKDAERRFSRLAARFKNTSWGEKAQYYLAETQFQNGRYLASDDSFELLNKTYPGTKYLDKSIERQFAVGDYWLVASGAPRRRENKMFSEILGIRDSQVKAASFGGEAPAESQPESAKTAAIKFDPSQNGWSERLRGRLPLMDLGSYGTRAIERTLNHDPTGPLADDALLRLADYYYAKGDHIRASEYYDQLLSEIPKSSLAPQAMLSSIDSKVKSYVGPQYEGHSLERAREQIKQAQALFAGNVEVLKGLYRSLDQLREAEAERAYHQGEFYQKVGKPTSAEYMFGMVVQKWPQSEWSKKANEQLAQLAKTPRSDKSSAPSKIMTMPGAEDPFKDGAGTSGLNSLLSPF